MKCSRQCCGSTVAEETHHCPPGDTSARKTYLRSYMKDYMQRYRILHHQAFQCRGCRRIYKSKQQSVAHEGRCRSLMTHEQKINLNIRKILGIDRRVRRSRKRSISDGSSGSEVSCEESPLYQGGSDHQPHKGEKFIETQTNGEIVTSRKKRGRKPLATIVCAECEREFDTALQRAKHKYKVHSIRQILKRRKGILNPERI